MLRLELVGTFDEAFKSRVQLALHYPPLTSDGREDIWRNFVRLLCDEDSASKRLGAGESVSSSELKDKIGTLAKHQLNGREIRNAITTARQLARFRNQPLGYGHISQAIAVANDFEAYIEKAHGHKAEEYARETGVRAD